MWQITTTAVFDAWMSAQNDSDRAALLAGLMVLRERGPLLPRPYADTVSGSRFSNMKELRIQSQGKPIRAFYAFDPQRTGIVLCAGNKGSAKRFYDRMIPVADREYQHYLNRLEDKE